MENSKSTKLIKSKSSNGTLAKPNQKNKKCCKSNGVLETMVTKKRGVYVERKPSEMDIVDKGLKVDVATGTPKERAPRRPSRGQKRFLSSVFTLLSKSSASTQHPDRAKNTVSKNTENSTETTTATDTTDLSTLLVDKMKKNKFRSRVLNSKCNDDDSFKVIQTKKMLVSSIENSECNVVEEDFDKIKWSDFLPRLVKPDKEEIEIEKEKKLSHLLREVMEGRKVPEIKTKNTKDEPATLVADKKDGLYNFFVDLLETTFSVYNMNAEYKGPLPIPSAISSKVAFEIDEFVAKKLNNVTFVDPDPDVEHTSKKARCIANDGQELTSKCLPNQFVTCKAPTKPVRTSPPRITSKRNPKLELAQMKRAPQPQKVDPQKTSSKKNNKRILLNQLKEQLKMEETQFAEPQNLYEALKVMAKAKRKSEKIIRFDKPMKVENDKECSLKCRKLLTTVTRLRPRRDDRKPRGISQGKRKYVKAESSADDLSCHSLEVYNVDHNNHNKRHVRKSQGNSQLCHTASGQKEPYDSYNAIVQKLLLTVEAVCRRESRPEMLMALNASSNAT